MGLCKLPKPSVAARAMDFRVGDLVRLVGLKKDGTGHALEPLLGL